MAMLIKLLAVLVLALSGVAAGRKLARSDRHWIWGFLLPLLVVALVRFLGGRDALLSFVPPFLPGSRQGNFPLPSWPRYAR